MNFEDCSLEHAVLHEVIFIPSAGGKGQSLKSTLNVNNPEGKQLGLKMTLLNEHLVFIETKLGSVLVPIGNFKLLVPMKLKQANAENGNETKI